MMNIVILDGYTANPGDLSWDSLKNFGELTVYERTHASDTVERAKDADMEFELALKWKLLFGLTGPFARFILWLFY